MNKQLSQKPDETEKSDIIIKQAANTLNVSQMAMSFIIDRNIPAREETEKSKTKKAEIIRK